MRSYFDRTSIKISVRKSTKTFWRKNPQIVYMPVTVVCHEVFYCVSGIINYNFDLRVSTFPKKSVVKMNHNIIFLQEHRERLGQMGQNSLAEMYRHIRSLDQ
jgi:hypothetical protein